ncbi:hypothetical protein [Providencia sp. PROV254]|uniref:hypothetical protein n=1 Tax=Providencia sp. PROV254 TaxID=2949942 RepID=UPI00234B477F|nr:hypothetical protein [Providencia sp. PROV254]HEP0304257.1 hypothetical protein [Providencia rettgeri]
MIAIKLSNDIKLRLESVSEVTGKEKSTLIEECLKRTLDSLEDEYIIKKYNGNFSGDFYSALVHAFKSPVSLKTISRNITFVAFSDGDKVYIENSKGKTRACEEKPANGFFEIYKSTGSLSPSSYRDATFNASYYLPMINYMIENKLI